jgi:hypothetical protein
MPEKQKTKTAPGIKTTPSKFPSPIKRNAPSVKPDPKAYYTPQEGEGWDNLSWESQRG